MINNTVLDDMPCKLIAILRGIEPHEIEEIVTILIEVGFCALEIPLNSPDPFQSIEKAVKIANTLSDNSVLIGAGTVLRSQDVQNVLDAGGQMIISPNLDRNVIESTLKNDMISIPGVFTASEALSALQYGAHMIKMFPSSVLGADGIAAIREVLPHGSRICAVGGIGANEIEQYRKKNIQYFGLGSRLYKAGMSSDAVKTNAVNIMKAYQDYS